MSLNEVIDDAQIAPHGEAPRNYGVVKLKDKKGSSVVFDRNKREFVKAKPHLLSRSRHSVDARSDVLSKLKGICEDVAGIVSDAYKHGKDLVGIARKYGLKTALQYEAEVFKQDYRDTSFAVQLYWAMCRDQMSAKKVFLGKGLSPEPVVVQVDNPRAPDPFEGMHFDPTIYTDLNDRGINEELYTCNSLGTGPGHDLYNLTKLLETPDQKPPENGDK